MDHGVGPIPQDDTFLKSESVRFRYVAGGAHCPLQEVTHQKSLRIITDGISRPDLRVRVPRSTTEYPCLA